MDASNCHRVNISKCEEMADIYVVNDADENDGVLNELGKQLVRHLALMLKPGIVSPTQVETCMQVANTAKLNSGCLSRQVGAVVTDKDYKILSVGWNTTPGNQVPCNLRSAYDVVAKSDSIAYSQYECENEDFRSHLALKLLIHRRRRDKINECREDCKERVQFFPYCFKDVYNGIKKDKNQVHTRSIHAEEMAFLNKTASCRDGILFTTSSPCELCAKKARHEGIGRVYYLIPYSGIADDHILKGAEPELKMDLFRGVTGGAFSKLYTPLLAQKDELYMRDGFRFTDKLEGVQIRCDAYGKRQFIRVIEDDKGEGKCAVRLDASASKFVLEEDKQNILIKYTLEKDLVPGTEEGTCPLCGGGHNGNTCEVCGYSLENAQERNVYLCADLCDATSKGRLKANRMHKYAWEKLRFRFLDERRFVLQSMANDHFVRALDDGSLVADVEYCSMDAPRTGCVFEIEFINEEFGNIS
jgi:deoxycytidylate deaminase